MVSTEYHDEYCRAYYVIACANCDRPHSHVSGSTLVFDDPDDTPTFGKPWDWCTKQNLPQRNQGEAA